MITQSNILTKLLLLRMMAAARFRIKPVDQHPMKDWLTFRLPEDIARKIWKDHFFSLVCKPTNYLYLLHSLLFTL
jgi:hypothetical protein